MSPGPVPAPAATLMVPPGKPGEAVPPLENGPASGKPAFAALLTVDSSSYQTESDQTESDQTESAAAADAAIGQARPLATGAASEPANPRADAATDVPTVASTLAATLAPVVAPAVAPAAASADSLSGGPKGEGLAGPPDDASDIPSDGSSGDTVATPGSAVGVAPMMLVPVQVPTALPPLPGADRQAVGGDGLAGVSSDTLASAASASQGQRTPASGGVVTEAPAGAAGTTHAAPVRGLPIAMSSQLPGQSGEGATPGSGGDAPSPGQESSLTPARLQQAAQAQGTAPGFELPPAQAAVIPAAPTPTSPAASMPAAMPAAGPAGPETPVGNPGQPVLHGEPQMAAREVRVDVSAGGSLLVGISMADEASAGRVTAGLDLLRHQLHAIGTEVEAIRVDVRAERTPDNGPAVDSGSGRQTEGQRLAGQSSGSGQGQHGHGAPGLRDHQPPEQGKDMHDAPGEFAQRRGLMVRPGWRKVDRYA